MGILLSSSADWWYTKVTARCMYEETKPDRFRDILFIGILHIQFAQTYCRADKIMNYIWDIKDIRND